MGAAPRPDPYYWAVDVLQANGANVHLAHPLGNDWGHRQVKNDERHCTDLLDRTRLHKLPEAWIAPPPVRELRELVRFRHKLVCLRTGLKAQVKAVRAKHGLRPPVNDLWGVAGAAYLNGLDLEDGYHIRIESLRDLVEHVDREVAMLERVIHQRLKDHPATGPSRPTTAWARPGRHLRHRDRRRRPVLRARGAVLVGRPDATAPGVGHSRSPRIRASTGEVVCREPSITLRG